MSNCARSYYSLENGTMKVENELFSFSVQGVSDAAAGISDGEGLSAPLLEVRAVVKGEQRIYCVWENLPVVWMPVYREDTLMELVGEHWTVRTVKLEAFTDLNDTLTRESFAGVFRSNVPMTQTGEIFYLENYETGDARVIICEMADYHTATLLIENGVVKVENAGNGLALGFCKIGECEALGREYYRHACLRRELVAMSNTWGDCHGASRVCQDFVLKEMDAARDIGIDIVQIDDGWQCGRTTDRTNRDEEGFRKFYEGFWKLDEERFPNGMKCVTEYAGEKGLRAGLWFAPDYHDNYALLERDKKVLRKAYEEWGFRFFKLDMFRIRNAKEQEKFLELLREIYSWGNDVAVQIDVTRHERLNYLCGRQYGTIFVENRYTCKGNAFPHRVLRNLWMIGRYVPTSKFQFELVNPDLYCECYREDDPFAPVLYDMDYLFAVVMLSNPLFWMELQFVSEKRRAQLKNIIEVWKKHRGELTQADVQPIGDRPSGRSFTGFYISKDRKPQYLLLFREVTEGSLGVFKAPVQNCRFTVLATNTEIKINPEADGVSVEFGKLRSYVFMKCEER